MSFLHKKQWILILVATICVVGLIVMAILLTASLSDEKTFNGTSVEVLSKREEIEDTIILWNSIKETHETPKSKGTKCAILVNNETYEYEDFETGWIAANTDYKNIGDLEFILYDDWHADGSGFLGTNGDSNSTSFNDTGAIVVNDWKNKLTINLNNYSINRFLIVLFAREGAVIYINNSEDVVIKNGCITGGASNSDGGGIWIGGDTRNTTLDGLTITGNVSGAYGGGVFVDDDITQVKIANTTIVGNYSIGYGGGVYMDFERGFLTSSSRLDLEGNVVIKNNKGCDNRNNLTLFCYDNVECAQLDEVQLGDEACIYVSFSRKDTVERSIVANVSYSTDNNKYFHVDDSECQLYTISLSYGTGIIGQVNTAGYGLCLRKSGGC